ncbi:hypothetical protein ABZP36_011467 [Zizania latifolia]
MSPPRTARSAVAAPCHQKGWLSVVSRSRVSKNKERCRCGRRKGTGSSVAGTLLSVQDDMLGAIFASGSLSAADVVRCTATCREWGRVVASRSEYVSRGLPPLGRYLSSLAVGIFTAPITHIRKPHFIPTAAGARLLGDRRISLLDGFQIDGELLNYARPITSRNGRLVLQLSPTGGASGVLLCVCNPMTGDLAMLPHLSSNNKPRRNWFPYGCALFTSDDFDLLRSSSTFFRLLLLYNNGASKTVLRCYSSDVGCWGQEMDITGVASISVQKMRQICPAVLRRSAAFWPLDDGALGVRLDLERPETIDVHLLPYCCPDYWPEKRLLGVSLDKRLFFIEFGMWQDFLSANLSYFDIDGDDISTGRENSEKSQEVLYPMFDIKMKSREDQTTLKLRWFCEKSGLILFTLGESSGYPGTFALDVRSPAVEKVVSGFSVSWRNIHLKSPAVVKVADGYSWSCFVGYEMDMATYLAALTA